MRRGNPENLIRAFVSMYKIKLSPYAKIFNTEWQLDPDSHRYNIPIDQILYGYLDVKRLRAALVRYVAECVVLNSHVQDVNEEPHWVKNDSINELEYINSPVDKSDLLNFVKRAFNIHRDPLYRFRLIRISDGVYRLVIVLHHLVEDGVSLDDGVFAAISNYYNDPNYSARYSIEEQIRLMTDLATAFSVRIEQNKDKYKEFWRQQLLGVEGVDLKFLKFECCNGNIVTSKANNPVGEIKFSYSAAELAKLTRIKKYVVTPYMYSQCIFALLLHRYTNQDRFAISYPIAIREGNDFIYGMQLNFIFTPYHFNQETTIAVCLDQAIKFFQLLRQDGVNYSHCPVGDIILNGNNQLFNVAFIQTNLKDTTYTFENITKCEVMAELNTDAVTGNMLLFEQEIKNDSWNFRVRYDQRFFDKGLLENFITSYRKLFSNVLVDLVNSNDQSIYSYDLLNQAQHQQLVRGFNQTKKDYPLDKTVCQLFEEQVLNTPDHVAAICRQSSVTYLELDAKANQFAAYLRGLGVKVGESVALYMSRSLDSIIAILGIIKSGAVYVPLDPVYSESGVQYMMQDSACNFCVTNDDMLHQCKKILPTGVSLLRINDCFKQKHFADFHGDGCSPLRTACIMYTSGSTGKPKGIAVVNRGIVRLVKNTNYLTFKQSDKIAHASSISFDSSTFEIWGALLNGSTIVVVPQDDLFDLVVLSRVLKEQSVTIMWLTAALFNEIVSIDCSVLSKLKYLLIGGEKLTPSKIHQFFKKNKTTKLINGYGPTESTVFATTFEIPRDCSETKSVPIGKPIANTTVYVLDDYLNLSPIGVIGELYIGGDGLAAGYLNLPELTAARFISNPFQTGAENIQHRNGKIYKTGDLVRMLPDGNLEYIGRNDLQVKIRGYRIELSEIESVLTNYPGVKQAVVSMCEYVGDSSENTSGKYLVAYYAVNRKLNEADLKMYLAKRLPKYMLPSIWIRLDALPLTVSGKVDRRLLPEAKFDGNSQHEMSSSEPELLICNAFIKVLSLKKVRADDDFFELGGNSIKAIALTAVLQANFNIKAADVFYLRTPRKLAANLLFGGNVLIDKLAQVKLAYQQRKLDESNDSANLSEKLRSYVENLDSLQIDYSLQKPVTNVLLTGVTGFLGCNLLNQLLKLTNYRIFLLVRAESQEVAVARVNKKFQFYFDRTLDNVHSDRLFIFKADLEKHALGLSVDEYQNLTLTIDSVIHAAALVKYYGDYDKFYAANVQATVNLLEFTRSTALKDFHYISTYPILGHESAKDSDSAIFTEDDMPGYSGQTDNVYIQTKLQGEHQVVKYREYGVNGNIYRLGNLAFMAENCHAQENVADNAFTNWVKCLLKLHCVAQEISNVEISPVDQVAVAIVKLFDKKQLDNNVYHIFNPYLFNISSDVTAGDGRLLVKVIDISEFLDAIIARLNDDVYHDLILKFLLRQRWLEDLNMEYMVSLRVLQSKTQYILGQLGFTWLPIASELFAGYLKLSKSYVE